MILTSDQSVSVLQAASVMTGKLRFPSSVQTAVDFSGDSLKFIGWGADSFKMLERNSMYLR